MVAAVVRNFLFQSCCLFVKIRRYAFVREFRDQDTALCVFTIQRYPCPVCAYRWMKSCRTCSPATTLLGSLCTQTPILASKCNHHIKRLRTSSQIKSAELLLRGSPTYECTFRSHAVPACYTHAHVGNYTHLAFATLFFYRKPDRG